MFLNFRDFITLINNVGPTLLNFPNQALIMFTPRYVTAHRKNAPTLLILDFFLKHIFVHCNQKLHLPLMS